MSSIKGNLTCVPIDTTINVANLPRNLHDDDVIPAVMKKNVNNKTVFLKEKIRPKFVEDAVKYLKEQELYKELGICQINESWANLSENDQKFFEIKDELCQIDQPDYQERTTMQFDDHHSLTDEFHVEEDEEMPDIVKKNVNMYMEI